MTYPAVPAPVPTRRERQRELNPLRYHPMVDPVRIPEPVHLEQHPRMLSVTALVIGLSSVLLGFTVLLPIAGIVFGIIGLEREPTRKPLAVVGIVASAVAGIAWAAASPALLTVLFP